MLCLKTIVEKGINFDLATKEFLIGGKGVSVFAKDIESIDIEKNIVRSGDHTSINYRIYFKTSNDLIDTGLSSGIYHNVRKLAEEISKDSGVDLSDNTDGKKVVRKSTELDQSVGEKLILNDENIHLPSFGPTSSVKVLSNKPYEADLGKRGLHLIFLLISVFTFVFASVATLALVAFSAADPNFPVFAFAFPSVFFLIPTSVALIHANTREFVKIDDRNLKFTAKVFGPIKFSNKIELNKIEEYKFLIDDARARLPEDKIKITKLTNQMFMGIKLISDDKSLEFAKHLSEEENQKLMEVIKYHMKSSASRYRSDDMRKAS